LFSVLALKHLFLKFVSDRFSIESYDLL